MAKVELKQPVVNEIKELLTDAQSAVLVSDRWCTVCSSCRLPWTYRI